MPLSGCRVLDLGIITAGAATSAMLADFGAEVIKVESPSYRDPFRRWLWERPSEADPGISPFFRATNRNKLGASINLKVPEGRAAFLELVRHSDIVVENFRRGVLEKLGLDFETLRAANPNIILASISSQGETGPEAGYVSYGSTLEAVGGLAWTTGYAGGAPTLSGVDLNYPDQIVALFASSMIVTAWRDRQAGGGAVHLDLSQRELTSFLSGEIFEADDPAPRQGNAQGPYAVQDCFKTADGAWLAISVAPDQAVPFAALAQGDAADWVATQPLDAAVAALAAIGVAASKAMNGHEVLRAEPPLWDHALQQSPGGAMVKGFPLQFAGTPMTIMREAPAIGADTRDVLIRVARFDEAQVLALRDAGAIELPEPPIS